MADRHTGMAVDAEVHRLGRARINHFLSLSFAPRLLPFFASAINPAKEITESMGAALTVLRWQRYRGFDRGDHDVRVVVVGDGRQPRTGALLACMTGWQVVSVDPDMKPHKGAATIDRLSCVRARIEDAGIDGADFVVAVHSHAPVEATRAVARVGGIIVSIPCCVPWPTDAGEVFVDSAMICPDRRVIVERRAA